MKNLKNFKSYNENIFSKKSVFAKDNLLKDDFLNDPKLSLTVSDKELNAFQFFIDSISEELNKVKDKLNTPDEITYRDYYNFVFANNVLEHGDITGALMHYKNSVFILNQNK